eukprot:Tbor_TRINITY_DN5705_c3_g3::TRINITY_DN5705_c3_g3_i1::g.20609::m.20609
MRRAVPFAVVATGFRGIAGVAPVIHFSDNTPKMSREAQVAKNTKLALKLMKRFKGTMPPAYTRKHSSTIEQIEKEIEALLGGAEKLRKNVSDDQPMDKLTLMERCLRHGLYSYKKDEGQHDFEAYKKWLVYTTNDESRVNLLRREVDLKEKYAAFKARRAAEGGPALSMPNVEWEKEYSANIDREVVSEKRHRYDVLAANTRDRDEAQIELFNKQFRKPTQDKRLDDLIDLLERFKPVLAREAIMQRLTIKHLEGQLGIWRYLDWCPEVRDRAELEVDNGALQWWMQWEEKRMMQIRLRSKNEVAEVMEKTQAEVLAKSSTTTTSIASSGKGSNEAARDKLLKEVLALQARINNRDDKNEAEEPKSKTAKH